MYYSTLSLSSLRLKSVSVQPLIRRQSLALKRVNTREVKSNTCQREYQQTLSEPHRLYQVHSMRYYEKREICANMLHHSKNEYNGNCCAIYCNLMV